MKCLFNKRKECPLPVDLVPIVKLGRLCQACMANQSALRAHALMKEATKLTKMSIITTLLLSFHEEKMVKEALEKIEELASYDVKDTEEK